MAKKKSQAPKADNNAGDDVTAEDSSALVEADELELLQVDLGDMVKIKQVLDEAVAAAILEKVEEDYKWDNYKLLVMTTACVFAMIAQFAPVPFPESRPILGICGSLYFILSGVLQFITTFIDKDAILLTKPSESSKNEHAKKWGIRVRSNLPRFSEWYTVILEFRVPKEEKMVSPPMVEQVWSIGQFFDKEGYFDEVGLSQEVGKLFQRFEEKKYANADEKKLQ